MPAKLPAYMHPPTRPCTLESCHLNLLAFLKTEKDNQNFGVITKGPILG